MSKLQKFEIVPFGFYRFIGKSVYARAGMKCGNASFAGFLWENSGWVFKKLDELSEYASNEVDNAALLTWEKCCEKSFLLGYTVGRFMKPDTPVPDGMDYFDISEEYMAKGYFDKETGNEQHLVREAIKQQDEYKRTYKSNLAGGFEVEVYGKDAFGFWETCAKK